MNHLISGTGAVFTAIVSALAVAKAALEIWRRTLGRHLDAARRIAKLGTNATADYFERTLGGPPAIRKEIGPFNEIDWSSTAEPASDNNSPPRVERSYERMIWVDRSWLVCAIAYEQTVVGFSVGTRDQGFHPSFCIWAGQPERTLFAWVWERVPWLRGDRLLRMRYPPFRLRLGRTHYSEVPNYPKAISRWMGARSIHYEEVRYFGNPGYYLDYVFAMPDSGPSDEGLPEVIDALRPSETHDGWAVPVPSKGTVPALDAFRRSARVRAVGLATWSQVQELDAGRYEVDPKASFLFVRHDEIRTFS